eukprot:Gregarina_sp_Poly_1__6228@NODE_32_length_19284_cov_132_623615_g29_i0_p2_GENE_NODE_32_length_19284_cov_132_623615_g29_i0NODE_32_length_19284_cov_132_623615_g29_i0_p2_ORF_typecomplete_len756_score69_30Glyco_hydro_19/PF00182_19/2e22CBM_5_12_2/PF14600_6/0_013CBM_5_12_2/PF14600_6/17CBM_5_12_2/PF14600_6/28CBM_5_12_2/PF14600_6/2_5e03DUF3670/PF12419_8/0_4CBM_5_12/PF02839_14/24CBM_5_12/PF02839_14/25KAR9/PF08580_10/2_3_NODE_32_length_19284_cov_132_623615_g29_i01131213579
MQLSFLVLAGAVSATLKCSDFPDYHGGVYTDASSAVNFQQHIWKALWWVNVPPGDGVSGWENLGPCEGSSDLQPCDAPAFDDAAVYADPTEVTYQSAIWVNKWYSAHVRPSQDPQNWSKLRDCVDNGHETTRPPATTTKPTTHATTRPTTRPTTPPPATTNPGGNPTKEPPLSNCDQTTPHPPIVTTTTHTPKPTTTQAPMPTTTHAPPVTTTRTHPPDNLPNCDSTTQTPGHPTTQPTAQPTTQPTARPTTNPGPVPPPINPTDPVGPNGECIWPEWRQRVYTADSYAGLDDKVYIALWYAGANDPPPSGAWKFVTTCKGTAPRATYTDEEMRAMVGDRKGLVRILDPWTPEYPTEERARAFEEEAREEPNLRLATDALRMRPLEEINRISPGNPSNPDNVKRVERFLDANLFEQIFPVRHKYYSYDNLLKGIGAFPAYCGTYTDGRDSDSICKKVLANSFAHAVQETSANWPSLTWPPPDPDRHNRGADKFMTPGAVIPIWRQGLWYVREMGHLETDGEATDGYRICGMLGEGELMWSLNYPCNRDRGYFGRGMKQLSWNYNYGAFSRAFYKDATVLLDEPIGVAESFLNFASAIWFAVTPQSPKPSMIWVIDGTWVPNAADRANGIEPGFGATINIINGGLECNKQPSQNVLTRVAAYKEFARLFDVDITGEQLYCTNQRQFTAEGAGVCPMYWYRVGGRAQCIISSIQTPWVATNDGDYMDCIDYNYRSHYFYNGERVADYGNVKGSGWPQ